MIRYRLECSHGHQFDSWFASSAAYDQIEAEAQLACAVCGTRDVGKALMAPSICCAGTAPVSSAPSAPPSPSSGGDGENVTMLAATPSPEFAAMRAAIRALREKIRSEAEYVGPRFAEEARRIHFDEAAERPIYGEATGEDVKLLAEDGIDVMPIPSLPEDKS